MTLWLTIIGMGIVTYLIRLVPIALTEKLPLSAGVKRALRYVPVAVLTAIIVPEILMVDGTLNASPENVRLVAGLFAMFVAWRTGNILVTVGAGMAAFWLLQLVIERLL